MSNTKKKSGKSRTVRKKRERQSLQISMNQIQFCSGKRVTNLFAKRLEYLRIPAEPEEPPR